MINNNKFLYNLLKTYCRRSLDKNIEPILKKYSKGKVLDIGALHQPYMKSIKYTNYKVLDIQKRKGVDIVEDIHKTKLNNNSFDTVVATEVFEHLYNPFLAQTQVRRILKKGGYLIASVPFSYQIHGAPHDYYRYTQFGLKELFKDFSKVQIIPHGNRFFVILDMIGGSNRIFKLLVQIFKIIPHFDNRNTKIPFGYIIIAKK